MEGGCTAKTYLHVMGGKIVDNNTATLSGAFTRLWEHGVLITPLFAVNRGDGRVGNNITVELCGHLWHVRGLCGVLIYPHIKSD